MIDPSRQKQALYLLHLIICQARSMALLGESTDRIAQVLDWAELLPSYLGSETDQTSDFENALDAIIEKVPEMRNALETFAVTPSAAR